MNIIDYIKKFLIAWLPTPIKSIIKKLLNFYRIYLKKDAFYTEAKRWFTDRGDETHRLNYSLSPDSIVFDLGGYKGNFAYAINSRYQCEVYLFEPIEEFYLNCTNRFKDNKKIHCFNFGLSSYEGEFYISDDDDGSSILKINKFNSKKVRIKSFSDFIKDNMISNIDLLKINIEGGEYDLIPHLIDTEIIKRIHHIQIQFHNFIKNSVNKRIEIRKRLLKTHKESWSYPFIWESWERL